MLLICLCQDLILFFMSTYNNHKCWLCLRLPYHDNFRQIYKKERGTFTKSTNKKNFALNLKSKDFFPNFIHFEKFGNLWSKISFFMIKTSKFEYTGFQLNFAIYILYLKKQEVTSKQTRMAFCTKVEFLCFFFYIVNPCKVLSKTCKCELPIWYSWSTCTWFCYW